MSVHTEVALAGLRLRNPLILASGILGSTASLLVRAGSAGAGAVTTKSITKEPRSGFENPVIYELEYGLLNAIGLANPGMDFFKKELKRAKQLLRIPLIASVAGSRPEEYADLAARAEEAGADAVELNLSCPHVKGMGLDVGHDPKLVREIVEAVKGSVNCPVLAKLSPNVTNIVEVGKAAIDGGADVLVAINTVRAMVIDVDSKKPVLSNKYGGLSGPAIHPIAVRCVYELYEAVGDTVPIIGVGGVMDWRDAVELMLAGARAVGIGTALYTYGLKAFKVILKGIVNYVKEQGFRNLMDITGLAHKYS
ncbi:MAG: dihydroorotate dehydrogenase [Thermoprotei archaeon]|nr:dihydroorotate dehydrogenase [Thermoprotei archaeon]